MVLPTATRGGGHVGGTVAVGRKRCEDVVAGRGWSDAAHSRRCGLQAGFAVLVPTGTASAAMRSGRRPNIVSCLRTTDARSRAPVAEHPSARRAPFGTSERPVVRRHATILWGQYAQHGCAPERGPWWLRRRTGAACRTTRRHATPSMSGTGPPFGKLEPLPRQCGRACPARLGHVGEPGRRPAVLPVSLRST
jgi:hypothetical protein